MSFVACCALLDGANLRVAREIDNLKERNTELEGVVRQQVEDIRSLQNRLAKAEEDRDRYRMKSEAGFGPW